MAEVRFIEQGHEILGIFDAGDAAPHEFIAKVARTCYQSEGKTADADERLVRSIIDNSHTAMVEHSFLSVKFTTNIGISRELVRHRLFSFAEQSTRYVNFNKKGFEFVLPDGLGHDDDVFLRATCYTAAERYEYLVGHGTKPEVARSVLPLCTATRVVVSGNFTEWRHMIGLRTASNAHPQMRALVTPLLRELQERVPVVFDDLGDA